MFTNYFGLGVCQHIENVLVHVPNNILSTGSVTVHTLGDTVGAANLILAGFKYQAKVGKWFCRGVEVGDVVTFLLVLTNLSAFFF